METPKMETPKKFFIFQEVTFRARKSDFFILFQIKTLSYNYNKVFFLIL